MQPQVRVEVVGLIQGQGPAVIPFQLISTDLTVMDLEAWMSNFGGSNVYIYEGILSLKQCEQDVKGGGELGCVLVLPESGPVSAPLDDSCRELTVYFEGTNNSGQTQAVCIKTTERDIR
jgi:hypothetical protein